MAETTDQPESGTTDNGLSDLMAQITAEFDKRFSGIQGLLDRRTSEWQNQLNELKTASMSPEEQEQFELEEAKRQIASLQRERDLLSKRKDAPDEVDFLYNFLKADSLEKQLDLLREFRKGTEEAAPQEPAPDDSPAPVDGNNPTRRTEASLAALLGKGGMTKESAQKLLEASNEPGLLQRLRLGS